MLKWNFCFSFWALLFILSLDTAEKDVAPFTPLFEIFICFDETPSQSSRFKGFIELLPSHPPTALASGSVLCQNSLVSGTECARVSYPEQHGM